MSARLNMNAIPLISWKGQTFNQLTNTIQKNGMIDTNINISRSIFSTQPIKHYRREIGVQSTSTCNPRTSLSIDMFSIPGGNITNTTATTNGLVNTLDFNITTNSSEIPGSCESECVVGTPEQNALRRVRSSGMIKKQFDISNDKSSYYTDSRQYLNSRNKTFVQNQYNYLRKGEQSATPGDSLSISNIYTTNSTTDCKKFYLSSDTSFSYTWTHYNDTNVTTTDENGVETITSSDTNTSHQVDVPSGNYDIDTINTLLHNAMILNYHYVLDANNLKILFIKIVYNSSTDKFEITYTPMDNSSFSTKNYSYPLVHTELNGPLSVDDSPTSGIKLSDDAVGSDITPWNFQSTTKYVYLSVANNRFSQMIGFTHQTYPLDTSSGTNVTESSNYVPLIRSRYNRVYYKPNNSQFAQQGAVSSSSRIARLKYNSITKAASTYRTAYGEHVANALAYGVPSNGYTVKDKEDPYATLRTPIFTTTGEMRCAFGGKCR
jgi:hypothetical protein